ncbi:MAG: hypothetical protein O3B43_06080 [Chloroflexi bacterium]|nr:hypothetical protein [Chloroflexota bacterium]
MSENELGETHPNTAKTDELEVTQPYKAPGQLEAPDADSAEDTQIITKKAKPNRRVFGAVAGLLAFVLIGSLGGYFSAIGARQKEATLQKAVEAFTQFGLGEGDLTVGNCDIARQRFSFVIELDPTYPGAAEKLAQSMLCAGTTGTTQEPALQASPEATPTPDPRGAEEIYNQSQGLQAAQNWGELLVNLDTLRGIYPDFEPIQVDGLYYIALRNRGTTRILAEGELESGIFDLNRAEQIGPLDTDAATYREWAILYIVAQSFWDVDWGQAVQFFSQLAVSAPNLHDTTFFTAQDRLAEAQLNYASQLIDRALFLSGAKGWCDAVQLLEEANSYSPHSPEVQPTAVWISEKCTLNPDSQPNIP